MSGHSKWHTIKRAKGKADAARGRVFNRLIREITVAARMGGGDINGNPRLRSAVSSARQNNMPSKNIDTAIKKGTGELEGVSYEEVSFEGYASGGVALIVDCLTDNRNRTVAEVRHVLEKHGGTLGATNSVGYMFKTKGIIVISKATIAEDALMDLVLEAGAEDMTTEGDEYVVTTPFDGFISVRDALEKKNVATVSAEIRKIGDMPKQVAGDAATKVLRTIDALDELDDIQNVHHNAEISEQDMAAYAESE
jgi:YebC/PmpR family DNA-binding regulatory protein